MRIIRCLAGFGLCNRLKSENNIKKYTRSSRQKP